MKRIIFQINGGIGKSIMATAVCAAIKKKYSKLQLIVVAAYPDVFRGNPNVDRILHFGETSYFYKDFIEDGLTEELFLHNPYLETKHIYGEEHLIKTWCEMYGLPYDGETPQLFISQREKEFYLRNLNIDKPLMVIQTNGGAENQEVKYSWSRDIPFITAQEVVNALKDDYFIMQIRRENQPFIPHTTTLAASFREMVAVIERSEKRLFMDSFAQHAAAAYKLPSTVCWIVNSPKVFGYDWNHNIVANTYTIEPDLKGSYLQKFNIVGNPMEFPYNNELEIFNAEQIIESLKTK
jgi:hypothetical protein